MSTRVAIIGDHFMLPEIFEEQIKAVVSKPLSIRKLQQGWPDQAMQHGYATPGMDGLKEYMGDADEISAFIDDAEVLVTHLAPMSSEMLSKLPALKLIAVSRGGPVNIDMQATAARGVGVVNAPGRNSSAVAEFTIGAILSETRLIRVGHEALRQGEWRGDLYRTDRTGRELCEMTVGVIGYGNIGTKVVRHLRAFGPKILVHDPYVALSDDDSGAGVEVVALEELLARSDVVTLHARVTEETQHMINAERLAMMKEGSLFVNTARGPMVDYDALYAALQRGKPAAAMLETFATEPAPADWPLLKLPNVTLTPHIAGASVRTVTYAAQMVAEELRRYLNGEAPLNPC